MIVTFRRAAKHVLIGQLFVLSPLWVRLHELAARGLIGRA